MGFIIFWPFNSKSISMTSFWNETVTIKNKFRVPLPVIEAMTLSTCEGETIAMQGNSLGGNWPGRPKMINIGKSNRVEEDKFRLIDSFAQQAYVSYCKILRKSVNTSEYLKVHTRTHTPYRLLNKSGNTPIHRLCGFSKSSEI